MILWHKQKNNDRRNYLSRSTSVSVLLDLWRQISSWYVSEKKKKNLSIATLPKDPENIKEYDLKKISASKPWEKKKKRRNLNLILNSSIPVKHLDKGEKYHHTNH